jgi:hypothetical protein
MFRRMDRLDWTVFSLVGLLLFFVAPAMAGRALSPYDPETGRPVLLTAAVIAEQRYLDEIVRPALALVGEADRALEEADRQVSRGVVLYQQAEYLRGLSDRLAATTEKASAARPPARFSSLHLQVVDLLSLYSSLVGEALAYYGDTNTEHWGAVRRGMDEGRPAMEMLSRVVEQVSLPVGPPRGSDNNGGQASPDSLQPLVEE